VAASSKNFAKLPKKTQPGWSSFLFSSENHPGLAISGCFAIFFESLGHPSLRRCKEGTICSISIVQSPRKNIEGFGFKLSDVKIIFITHYHDDAAGSAAWLKQKSGAQIMAGFPEIGYLERGGTLAAPEQGGKVLYPPFKVDRGLFDGDVIKLGPLSITAYILPGHTLGSTSYAFTAREGNRDLKVFQFCCWEYPENLWQNTNISEASAHHIFESFRKIAPVDIYLANGAYESSGMLNHPAALTAAERVERLKADRKVWVNRAVNPTYK
jgi:Metallo-beta-lactamase superfamily